MVKIPANCLCCESGLLGMMALLNYRFAVTELFFWPTVKFVDSVIFLYVSSFSLTTCAVVIFFARHRGAVALSASQYPRQFTGFCHLLQNLIEFIHFCLPRILGAGKVDGIDKQGIGRHMKTLVGQIRVVQVGDQALMQIVVHLRRVLKARA